MNKRNRNRMSIEFSPKVRKVLERLATEKEVTFSEVIRNSLLLYDYLNKEVKNGAIIKVDNKEIITMFKY